MKVLSLADQPLHQLDYAVSTPRGPDLRTLPFLVVTVDALPAGLEALVLTSDLQGRADFSRPDELAGLAVAEELELLADDGTLPPPERIGILLGGDLFAHPPGSKLGGFGDVREVWRAFADRFAWVVGVAGNHDDFGGKREARRFVQGSNWTVLDLEGSELVAEYDGLRIAGVGGILGRPEKPHRRSEEDFEAAVDRALATRPDLLITHQHPAGLDARQSGSEGLARALQRFAGVSAFGHKHVPEALHRLHPEGASLAMDGRLFVLTRPAD